MQPSSTILRFSSQQCHRGWEDWCGGLLSHSLRSIWRKHCARFQSLKLSTQCSWGQTLQHASTVHNCSILLRTLAYVLMPFLSQRISQLFLSHGPGPSRWTPCCSSVCSRSCRLFLGNAMSWRMLTISYVSAMIRPCDVLWCALMIFDMPLFYS